jgi:lipopolysaccharide/colanic/teichoic acid biosynthesis glycosyltransferase
MIKRLFDVVVAALALLLLSPLFLLLAVAIKLESRGPVFFRQTRVGRDRQPFTMLKFRKFPTAYDGQGPGLTAVDDYRLTRVGRLLERWKLDELPQFVNVLRGEMSLVGPRPETPNFVAFYRDADFRVLDVKPGLFGINQLLFRREAEMFPEGEDPEAFYVREIMPRKLANDIDYIQRANVLTDLGVLFRCVWHVVEEPIRKRFAGESGREQRPEGADE